MSVVGPEEEIDAIVGIAVERLEEMSDEQVARLCLASSMEAANREMSKSEMREMIYG